VATERELAEAHSFVRRRLLKAFVSGAFVGREVEGGRPGRAAVAGVAMGSLLMAAGAVSDVLARHPESDGSPAGTLIRTHAGSRAEYFTGVGYEPGGG
jgi:hypothetical protein